MLRSAFVLVLTPCRQELATRLHLCRVCKVVLLDLLVLRVWTLRPSVLIVPFSVCAVYPAAFGAGSHGGLASWPSRSGLGEGGTQSQVCSFTMELPKADKRFQGSKTPEKDKAGCEARDEGLIWEKLVD